MNRRVLLAALVVVVPIVAILWMNLGRDPHRIESPVIGRTAPSFVLREAGTGEAVSLESFRGKPVVINFWATWCVPCYAEHEALVQSASTLGDSVQFLGVVYQDREEAINDFLQQNGRAYPALMDDSARTAIAYGVYGVPETFFIRADGIIAAKFEGALTPEAITEKLRQSSLGGFGRAGNH